jgi:hypothetical protein
MNKYIVILGILFSSLSYSYDESYAQCKDDIFFRIDDPEEPSIFSKGDDGGSRLYRLKDVGMEGDRILWSSFDAVRGRIIAGEAIDDPSANLVKSEGIILNDKLVARDRHHAITSNRTYSPWHLYIDRKEGEAWYVLPKHVCASGCDATLIEMSRYGMMHYWWLWDESSRLASRGDPTDGQMGFVKAIKLGSCVKTSKRKIKKYFSKIEKANKPVKAKTKF